MVEFVQMEGCDVVEGQDEIRFCGGNRTRDRHQRRQAVVSIDLAYCVCLYERVARRTDSFDGAPCIY